jgi:hypothetical protein
VSGRRPDQELIAVIAIVLALAVPASAGPLIDRLATSDRTELAAAVAAVEAAAPDDPELGDALFVAARACEDTLVDPPRALALYERILRDFPDAGVAIAARRRAEALRGRIGRDSQFAHEAGEFARLVAEADSLRPNEVLARGEALSTPDWSGAPEVALWLAEWQRRRGLVREAQARYVAIAARWPGSRHAIIAIRGGAGTAIDLRDWDRAEDLANSLPALEPADRVLRDELLESAARGRFRDRMLLLAWIVLGLAAMGLAASLAEAALRGGRRRPVLRPPIEVVFMVPVAFVLGAVALTTHQLIAPAVIALSVGGLALAWISGATLDTLRARNRPTQRRALGHAGLCLLAIVALLYILLMHDNLLDMVIETVRFGPEG